uniref:Uncharacterized protein n=1 Tax=Romanomermis culicivorax TaxID=13658 RepID=A0A915I1Q4_ROMCU
RLTRFGHDLNYFGDDNATANYDFFAVPSRRYRLPSIGRIKLYGKLFYSRVDEIFVFVFDIFELFFVTDIQSEIWIITSHKNAAITVYVLEKVQALANVQRSATVDIIDVTSRCAARAKMIAATSIHTKISVLKNIMARDPKLPDYFAGPEPDILKILDPD